VSGSRDILSVSAYNRIYGWVFFHSVLFSDFFLQRNTVIAAVLFVLTIAAPLGMWAYIQAKYERGVPLKKTKKSKA